MENLKSIPRLGGAVEAICTVMAVLSLIGGVICAVQFGDRYEIGYAGRPQMVTSPALVIAWLAGGMGAAAFWWIMGRIGTALRWLEGMADAAYGPEISEHALPAIPEPSDVAPEEECLPEPKPAPKEKSPEQLAQEAKDSRHSMLTAGIVLLTIAVIFYFFIRG